LLAEREQPLPFLPLLFSDGVEYSIFENKYEDLLTLLLYVRPQRFSNQSPSGLIGIFPTPSPPV